jgi:hypothetical protein
MLLAGQLDDLHSFDPTTMIWTRLSAADDAGRPSARDGHGFTSAGGRLYVHGGYCPTGSGYWGEAGTNEAVGARIVSWVDALGG